MTSFKEKVEAILEQEVFGDLPSDISTSLQLSTNEFVFYRLHDDRSIISLLKRLPKEFSGILITNKKVKKLSCRSLCLSEKNFEKALIDLTKLYYPISAKTKTLAVTGTNGKTSTCWFVSQILSQNDKNQLYIGTIGVFHNGKKTQDEVMTTTPSFVDLRKLAHRYLSSGGYLVLELSSHALKQERLADLLLDVAGWTSFSQDHLDSLCGLPSQLQVQC